MSSLGRIQTGVLLATGLALAGGCYGPPADEEVRRMPASTIMLRQADAPGLHPPTFADLRRDSVEFDHALHLKVVEKSGAKNACGECHPVTGDGTVVPLYKRERDPSDREELTGLYHDNCMGCHKGRASAGEPAGPVICGECHVDRGPGVSARREIVFDYSLHHRHDRAYPDKCGACHHLLDETSKKLVYLKGAESACRDCHLDRDQGKNHSLENASHRACIRCHRERAGRGHKSGPWACSGCHDAEKQARFEQLADLPRLMRKQPDLTWIRDPQARARLVPFDHQLHEPLTRNCSVCHHKTLKPCRECHKIHPVADGGGVSLERAYHLATSERSCVGCHETATGAQACRGCHASMEPPPAQESCGVCHSGPKPTPALGDPPLPEAWEIVVRDLPADGWDFPGTVVIDRLKNKYAASTFPHRKIVEALHKPVAQSKLAATFHGRTETLCAGCHHHSPVGARPPPCGACHDDRGHDTRDQPDLLSAYHRQCLGCHREMKLKQQGCEDCHPKAGKEVSP